jgi:hypothetical protein
MITRRLLALQQPLDSSKQATCQFALEPLTRNIDLVVSGSSGSNGSAASQTVAESEAPRQEEALFAGASHCTPKHRRKPRTASDVRVGEWVAIAIAGALIVFLVVMLVFLYRPSSK